MNIFSFFGFGSKKDYPVNHEVAVAVQQEVDSILPEVISDFDAKKAESADQCQEGKDKAFDKCQEVVSRAEESRDEEVRQLDRQHARTTKTLLSTAVAKALKK